MSDTQDFSAFMLADTSAVEIDLPNGEPMYFPAGSKNRVVVHVHGPATDRFIAAQDALQRFSTSNIKVDKRGTVKNTADSEENRKADAKFLAAITERFDNFPFPGGPLAIYGEARFKYIADQVRAHLADLGNFFPQPPQT